MQARFLSRKNVSRCEQAFRLRPSARQSGAICRGVSRALMRRKFLERSMRAKHKLLCGKKNEPLGAKRSACDLRLSYVVICRGDSRAQMRRKFLNTRWELKSKNEPLGAAFGRRPSALLTAPSAEASAEGRCAGNFPAHR